MTNQFDLNTGEMKLEQQQEISLEKKETEVKQQLLNDPKVQEIAKRIDFNDTVKILEFGKEPAEKISSAADVILRGIKVSEIRTNDDMIKKLQSLMGKLDLDEIKQLTDEEKETFFKKLFNRGKDAIERILEKYQTVGHEIEGVTAIVQGYETATKKDLKNLEGLWQKNYEYYFELEKYITAAEIRLEELRNSILPRFEQMANSGNEQAQMNLTVLKNAEDLLSRRVTDLKVSKTVSMQTAKQIELLIKGDSQLLIKINSAFITAIPIFKMNIVEAVAIKKQRMAAKGMAQLDEAVNKIMIKNAQNIADHSKQMAEFSGQQSIKIETIQETFRIIQEGIRETQEIEARNLDLRKQTEQVGS